ncbi:hypothetical protein [Bradyrhizobium sp. CCGUVB23]|uniref:hypothetical protein n=1 Tax=Bradyrhizobium sp. CCGUVB23 TaxID=2949630 RepID=UPI0020B254CD|nr:hypothetical protein [Bradyrhizobium sp. CCGUVB23]MCP3459652.1 hypothetical protein [Bradyrhizobium sp. CCGUVB23]
MSDEGTSASDPSAFSEATATIRDVARSARQALGQGQEPGQWKAILRDLVREAPLPSLAVAFMLGVLVARR